MPQHVLCRGLHALARQQCHTPGYGAPAPRPPPPPRNPGLSGGYAGGNAPRRPQQARPQQAPNNYGGPVQQAPNNYGGPVQQAPSNYGGPQQQQAQDSYGSPQADPIANQDSYGSPQAAPIGNQDSYGSPVAAPVGPQGGGQRTPSSDFGPSSVFYEKLAPFFHLKHVHDIPFFGASDNSSLFSKCNTVFKIHSQSLL